MSESEVVAIRVNREQARWLCAVVNDKPGFGKAGSKGNQLLRALYDALPA